MAPRSRQGPSRIVLRGARTDLPDAGAPPRHGGRIPSGAGPPDPRSLRTRVDLRGLPGGGPLSLSRAPARRRPCRSASVLAAGGEADEARPPRVGRPSARAAPRVEWTPPKLVASATSSRSARKRCARSAPSSVKPTSGPNDCIWRAAIAWCGWSARPGWRTSSTSGRSRSQRARASAFALWRSSRRASVASERCSSQASNGPGDRRRPGERCARSRAAHSGSRTETAPRTRSEWPESALVAL